MTTQIMAAQIKQGYQFLTQKYFTTSQKLPESTSFGSREKCNIVAQFLLSKVLCTKNQCCQIVV